jgi:hypothetical protein
MMPQFDYYETLTLDQSKIEGLWDEFWAIEKNATDRGYKLMIEGAEQDSIRQLINEIEEGMED